MPRPAYQPVTPPGVIEKHQHLIEKAKREIQEDIVRVVEFNEAEYWRWKNNPRRLENRAKQ